MNGTRFLLAIVVGILLGAAIVGCPDVGQIGCENPDNSIVLSCGIIDPCNCYADAGVDVGELNRGVCSLPNPCADAGDGGADGPTADASADANIPSCTGQCLPTPPWPWSGPVLLTFTTDAGLAACPPSAPVGSDEIYTGLDAAPAVCAPCVCEPSDGGCDLPTMTASVAGCADAGPHALSESFGPSSGWDGGCSAQNAISGESCLKDGTTCIQSVTISPLAVDEGCAVAAQSPPVLPPVAWGTTARVCTSGANGPCASLDETCGPAGAVGFQQCVYQEGQADCPADVSPYTEPYVFFQGVADMRGCSTCSCGPVDGGACSALISIYSDSACHNLVAADTVTASANPLCLDVPAGSALGSVLADAGPYVSGTCQQSDAGPTGSAEGSMPATFCCLPM